MASTNLKNRPTSGTSTAGAARTSSTTRAESTLGGGVKAPAGIVINIRASAKTWTAIVARLVAVEAVQRSATSFWTTSERRRGRGGLSSSLGMSAPVRL